MPRRQFAKGREMSGGSMSQCSNHNNNSRGTPDRYRKNEIGNPYL